MTEENSFTDEDLSRIRQKAFSSELKGLILKVTREDHPEDSVIVSDPLYSASNLFYRILNRSYLNSDFIEDREFRLFTEESHSNADVFCYDYEKSVYSSDSSKSIVPTKDFFRKLRKKKPFDFSFSGSTLKIFPFSGFTEIFDNECFPPFVISPDGDFCKLTSINVLLRRINNREYESDFINLSNILIQLSDYYDKVFLISLSKSEKLPESLYLLSRIKSIVFSKCPDAEIVITSPVKMVLFADSASAEKALSLAVENEKVVFEEIKNVRNEIFPIFG